MALFKCNKCCLVTTLAVGVIAVLIAAVSYPVLNKVFKDNISKQVMLVNGSHLYETWKEPTLPVYMQVYIFDLQNPEEVLEGSKPVVIQRGPFTYNEHKVKLNITHYSNGTLSYRQNTTYYFNRELSAESDDINVTTINVAFMVLAGQLKQKSSLPKWINDMIQVFSGELVFIKRSVRQIVFGYDEPLLTWIKEYVPKELLPFPINNTKVGIFANKNNTNDGEYTIFTGESNITLLGIIDKYNGESSVDYWTTPEANMINGSDGTICPPFVVTRNLKVMLFSTDICRSVYGVYQEDVKTPQGINLYRYSAPKEVFQNVSLNPDNAGFCTPAGNCLGTGVLNVSTCQSMNGVALPIVVSYPHFYMADKSYQDAVEGLNPNLPHLSTDIDIEPHTGFVMQIAKRLQINVHVVSMDNFDILKNLQTMVYPVLWVNESVAIDDKSANQFKSQLLVPMTAAFVTQVLLFAFGGFMILVVIIVSTLWIHRKKETEEDQSPILVNENEPDA